MKRLLTLALAGVLALGLGGCWKDEPASSARPSPTPTASAPAPTERPDDSMDGGMSGGMDDSMSGDMDGSGSSHLSDSAGMDNSAVTSGSVQGGD